MRRSTVAGSETPARVAHATNASTSPRYAWRVARASDATERTKPSSSKLTAPRYPSGRLRVLNIALRLPRSLQLGDNGYMAHRVLLVEDDERIRTSMRLSL